MREWALVLMLFRAAPLAWGALAFAGGLLLSDRVAAPWPIFAAGAVIFLFVAAFSIRSRREGLSWLSALLTVGILAAGHLRIFRLHSAADSFYVPALPLRDTTVVGTILTSPVLGTEDPSTRFELSPQSMVAAGRKIASPPARIKVTLNWSAPRLNYGDVISVPGTLRPPAFPTNPGQSDSRIRWRREGIAAGLSCWKPDELQVLESGRGNPVKRRLEEIRRWAVARVARLVGAPQGHLLASMLFGARQGLATDVLDSFRDTGLVHVLVTSGLHVGLLAWMSLSLFSGLGISRRSAAILTLSILAGYLALCGGRPPLLRSTLMFSLLVAGDGLGRGRSAVNSLGVAGLVIMLFNPEMIWDPSFNFSFAATFAILALAPWFISRRGPVPMPVAQVAACTLAAQLSLLPLLAANFQKVSFLGTFANLLVIPAMGLFLGIGFMLLAVGWIPGIGPALGQLAGGMLFAAEALVDFFAALPLASIIVPAFSASAIIAYVSWILGFLAWRAGSRPGAALAPRGAPLLCLAGAAGLALLVWRAALAPAPGDLSVTFLDVGHGLAAVIRLPSGRTVLFDGGTSYAGQAVVAPFLKSTGVGRLAAVVLSHPHADHSDGLVPILRQLSADSIYCGAEEIESARLRASLLRRGVPCRQVRAGDEIAGEPGVRIRFLSPPYEDQADKGKTLGDMRDRPAVLAVSHRNSTILLTGDISSRIERRLIPAVSRLESELLMQVPHHGSVSSSSRAFLAAAKPTHAVISAGRFRRSPHPHPATLIRLRDQGARIWNTAQSGAITAVANENGWSLAPAMPVSP